MKTILITLAVAVAVAAAVVFANNKGYFPGSPIDKDTGKVKVE